MKKQLLSALLVVSVLAPALIPVAVQADSEYPYQTYQYEAYQGQPEQPEQPIDENGWLTMEERIYGLSIIWRRAAEMSGFIAARPYYFDWDALFLEYMPKVINAENMQEYYRVLTRFVNHLQDGKSAVQLPAAYAMPRYVFPIVVGFVENSFVLVTANTNFTDIPLGSEIISINELAPMDFLEETYGYTFGNRTPIVRETALASQLTISPYEASITLEALTPQGETIRETITYIPFTEEFMAYFAAAETLAVQATFGSDPIPLEHGATAVVHDGDIHRIIIATFGNPALPEAVVQYIESVAGTAAGFILDIRGNNGGTSDMLILSQFADPREFPTPTAYRQVRDASIMGLAAQLLSVEMMGWAVPEGIEDVTVHGFTVQQGRDMLESRHLQQLYDFGGMDLWDADLLYEQSLRLFDIPVVILMDYMSASAAESFVLSAQGVNNFTVMGTHTIGMAGDIVPFVLPGGGMFMLNVPKQLTPDGQIINNQGVSPDIWVQQSLADLLDGIDTQLLAALEYLG